MATVEELARDIVGSLASDAGAVLAAKWIDNRYQELVSKARFRHLRSVGEVYLPAVVDSGTVTTTRGSTAVTGTDTTWATSPTVATHEYWYFKASSAWYEIASVAGDESLTLATAFAEDAVTAGTYAIVQRHIPLASDARWLGVFAHTRLRRAFTPISLDEMNMRFPGRVLTGSYPVAVAQVGVDSNGYLMVEFYPPCTETEIIHYVYWSLPSTLSFSSTIPAQIDARVLKEGALIDSYRYKKAQALDKGKVEVAATWRNEERAQQTRWERAIQDACRTDRGVDDVTLILNTLGGGRYARNSDQRTARDIVLDRWSWPSYV